MAGGKRVPGSEALSRLSVEKRQEYIDAGLRDLVAHAYRNALAVKERFDRAGVRPERIRTADDLELVPIIRKNELLEEQKRNPPFGGNLAVPIGSLEHIFQSPGPMYEPEHGRPYPLPLGIAPGFAKGQVAVNTWSYHMVPGGFIYDRLLKSMGCTVVPAGTGNTDNQVQLMRDLKVSGFAGTPSFLKTIIDRAEAMGLDVKKDFNLKWAMVGGEMGGGPLRKLFSEKYGIRCLGGDIYGTADVGVLSSSCESETGMHFVTDAYIELVNPATGKRVDPGEVGEIVATPFDDVYPLIRFGTGDLSSLHNTPCPCGRTTPRLTRILGRTGDAVRVRGMFVHPKQADESISRFPAISQYQLVVTRSDNRDHMTLRVELAEGTGIDRDKLKADLEDAFRGACKVRFDRMEVIPGGTLPKDAKHIVDERSY